MLLAFTTLDYAVLGFYLALLVVIGWYFSDQQHDSEDYFLAGRSMGWFPVGLSVMATLLSALSYTGIPGEAYHVGWKFLLHGAALWLTVPVMFMLVMPLYYRLRLTSVYEYLEFRFSLAVRLVSSAAFVVWRLLWMGGVLYAPCKVLALATGMESQLTLLVILLGGVATVYTFLGGMKAVIWTDVVQSFIMLAGLVAIIGGAWFYLDGGLARIWEVTAELGRSEVVQLDTEQGFFQDRWLLWGMLPHFFFAALSFYVADQITVQRFFTTPSLEQLKRSYLLNCFSVLVMVSALTLAGLALLAFYHDHPQQMKPYWVANLARDAETGEPLVRPDTGRPYITRSTDMEAELELLIEAGALLDPNTQLPLEDQAIVTDSTGRLVIGQLGKRDPRTGEIVLERGQDELMPHFMVQILPSGIAGVIFAALLAASMSSLDSGLNSVTALGITDFYRRLGWGRAFVARLRGKAEDKLDESDELWISRCLVLVIGVAATLFALWVATLENIFDIMLGIVNTFGAPLLGVFLLGMLTRRTNAQGALTGLLAGIGLTVWLSFGSRWGLCPWSTELNPIWSVTFGLIGTLAIGYVSSLFRGQPKTTAELSGLVWGIGRLGVRPAALEVARDDDRNDAQ